MIEGAATLKRQSLAWAVSYGLLMALVAACAVRLWKAPVPVSIDPMSPIGPISPIAWPRRLRWLALSLVPSSLLLGVTSFISAEVAPMPFLWVVPLALYLLTFVLVFAGEREAGTPHATAKGNTALSHGGCAPSSLRRTILPLRWMVRWQPLLIVVATATLLCSGAAAGMREFLLFGSLHLATFFVTAMVCHGQLAADRPPPGQLTEFYLWMSLGGVVGGLLTALVAPLVFKSVLEYPLMMAAACLLRPRPEAAGGEWGRRQALPLVALLLCLIVVWGLRTGSFLSGLRFADTPVMRVAVVGLAAVATFLLRRRPMVFGIAVAALAAMSLWSVETRTRLLDAQRSFFGILRVEYDPLSNTNQLLHGTTSHGQQSLFPSQRHEPQGYYHRTGPLGAIFDVLKPRRPLAEVGVLGLGVGTIAAYAEPGERFTFYEIDPAVESIARNQDYFTYLADCRGQTEVILGDARLSLEHGPARQFDLLIVNVYSSDSVPVHLTTREALKIYFDRLKPRGLLAIHISSRYLNLEPFLGNLAADAGLTAGVWRDLAATGVEGRVHSVWVVMARSLDDLGSLPDDNRWQPLACDPGPVWTDDFSNVAAALRWEWTGLHLKPWRWEMLDPAEVHTDVAIALVQNGRIDEAIEHFQKSLEINPDNAPIHYALGMALASRARTDEAIAHFEEALRLDPSLKEAHSDLGIALDRKGQKDEALEHFRKAVAIASDYVDGLRNLGKALLDRQLYGEAADCFRKALALQPRSAELRYDLGLVLTRQGKIAEAKQQLQQALALAEQEQDTLLAEKIKAEIRRCEQWPWEEERK